MVNKDRPAPPSTELVVLVIKTDTNQIMLTLTPKKTKITNCDETLEEEYGAIRGNLT